MIKFINDQVYQLHKPYQEVKAIKILSDLLFKNSTHPFKQLNTLSSNCKSAIICNTFSLSFHKTRFHQLK